MKMRKPQEKNEWNIKSSYSERVQRSYELVSEEMDVIKLEYLDEMVDRVYKEAYLDGFRDALFFADLL